MDTLLAMNPWLGVYGILGWAFWWYLAPFLANSVKERRHRLLVTLTLLTLLGIGLYGVWAAFSSLQHLGGGMDFLSWTVISAFALLPTFFLTRWHLRSQKSVHVRA